ncbi:hypothetical protein [Derxia lacustris]|uniref:hypothetical protein n=1 Tax=Derxia lacustris TaxID=764842 RepID=UPI00111C1ACB|nr:hypothetical protein [Derxia lacustris]
MSISFVDSTGAALASGAQPNVSGSTPLYAVATFLSGKTPLVNQLVTFTAGTAGLVTFDPSTGATLTDSNGQAKIAITAAGDASGAMLITASAVTAGNSTTTAGTYTASAGVQVNGVEATSLTLDPTMTLSPTTLSAYGTATATVKVLQSGSVYRGGATVTFAQGCGTSASITTSVVSQNDGTASATFTDAGCAVSGDKNTTITATLGSSTVSGTLAVKSPSSGSLMFTAVSPTDAAIIIQDNGAFGRQQYATLTFKLVDLAGKPVPNVPVCFDVAAYTGGLNIDSYYFVDDSNKHLPAVQGDSSSPCQSANKVRYLKSTGTDGTVQIQVNSGTTSTSVKVLATAYYPVGTTTLLATESSKLTISSGRPFQSHFDLAIDKANIDGREYSGETAVVTAHLSDWFSNPVPDGTVVSMIASGGAICTSSAGSCTTVNGNCSCTLVTQERRPSDGRVVVLAYAKGSEDYKDNNQNNIYDSGDGFTTSGSDANDLPDAFLDSNKSGAFESSSDVGIAAQGTGNYVTGDGVWTKGGVDLRRSGIVYFSSYSNPTFILIPDGKRIVKDSDGSFYVSLAEDAACTGNTIDETLVTGWLDDGYGNPMASGTTISVSSTSKNVAADVTLGSTVASLGLRAPSVAIDGLNAPKTSILAGPSGLAASVVDPAIVNTSSVFKVRGVANACTGEGWATINVKSPRGSSVPARILFRPSLDGTVTSGYTRDTGNYQIRVKFNYVP